MRIMIRRDAAWEELVPTAYLSEAQLQAALAEADNLVPGDASTDEEAMVYCREFPTASGPIDLVGIGSSGSVTVMECKLARNRQVKREVVGQVLDYAAHLWRTDAESFLDRFTQLIGEDPFARLRSRVAAASDWDESHARSEVARRLESGQFRLLIAVDEIDVGLRRIIQYVNTRSARDQIRLVAMQFPLYRSEGAEVVVTETYGDELAGAPLQPTSTGARWTTEQYRDAFHGNAALVTLHDRFVEWAQTADVRVVYGRGSIAPSVSFQLWTDSTTWYPLFVIWPERGGRVEIPVNVLSSDSRPATQPLVDHVIERLNQIPGIALPDRATGAKSILAIDVLTPPTVTSFLDTFDWLVHEVRRRL